MIGRSIGAASRWRGLANVAAAVCALVVSDFAAPVHAQSTGQPDCPFEPIMPPPAGFYRPVNAELWAQVFLHGDWYDVPHPTSGVGLDFVLLSSPGRTSRFGPYTKLGGGTWGDVDHGDFTAEPGLSYRQTFAMNDVFDEFIVLKTGLPMGTKDGGHIAFRGGAGAGFRVFRGVQIEATFDPLVGLDAPFSDKGRTNRVRFGGTLEVGIDLCLFGECKRKRNEPEPIDRTCPLYEQAAAVCRDVAHSAQPPAASPPSPKPLTDHEALCASVRDAMDPAESRPHEGVDATQAFLAAVIKRAPASAQRGLAKLVADHIEARAARDCSDRFRRQFAQVGAQLKRPIVYAPYASELRRAFGCDTSPPQCGPACESFAPSPAR
jgi:hypothetical protein